MQHLRAASCGGVNNLIEQMSGCGVRAAVVVVTAVGRYSTGLFSG